MHAGPATRQALITDLTSILVGGNGAEDTPVPIPNTAVKLCSADGTAGETRWESTSPPTFLHHTPPSAPSLSGASCIPPHRSPRRLALQALLGGPILTAS